MGLFDRHFDEIKSFIRQQQILQPVKELENLPIVNWPTTDKRNFVLGSDTAVELGSPRQESVSFLIWVNDSKVKNGRIRLIGPDISEVKEKEIPFGRIVIIGGKDFDETNYYHRFRKMENLRYEINLKGYMLRAAPQLQREWSRINKEAIASGFDFQILGSEILNRYLMLDYVTAAEAVFVTSGNSDVASLKPIANSLYSVIGAMNKLNETTIHNCVECDYSKVCDDIQELKAMRKSIGKKEVSYEKPA